MCRFKPTDRLQLLENGIHSKSELNDKALKEAEPRRLVKETGFKKIFIYIYISKLRPDP